MSKKKEIISLIIGFLAAFLLFSVIRHRILLAGEKDMLTPPRPDG